ncbi:MAG TPA: ABC transporter substrate-binding protein [Actinomycetota bacterium]|nr:ABC transporter substrate-binding protein [Actinomycetota bacterium]
MARRTGARALLVALLVGATTLAACGEDAGGNGDDGAGAGGAATDAVTLSLDWVPNPDHAGLYYAQENGMFEEADLDVDMQAPSDPAAPLKLVGVNEVDLAISYQPELFFAAEEDLPVVAVASIVPVPLNSLVAPADAGVDSVDDLAGKKVGSPGLPTSDAFMSTMLEHVGLSLDDVELVNVGYNLLPAMLSGRVSAVIGAYGNVEGIEVEHETHEEPTVIRVDEAGVPTYDELVLVANSRRLESDDAYADVVERFIGAMVAGTEGAQDDVDAAVDIMIDVTDYEDEFLRDSVPVTLDLMTPPGGRRIGCMDAEQWQAFGDWMLDQELIEGEPDASAVMTNDYAGDC